MPTMKPAKRMTHEEQVECLIAKNRRLVGFVFSRIASLAYAARLSRAELISEGRVGLWKAADRYEPTMGRFSSFAVLIIHHAMLTRIACATRQCRYPPRPSMSLSKPLKPQEPEEGTLGDILASDVPGPDAQLDAKMRKALIRRLMMSLSHVERQVIVERVMSGKTLIETTRALAPNRHTGKCYTRQRVSQIEHGALGKMRKLAEKLGLNGDGN